MASNSSTSSEGSGLPQRQRPSIDNLMRDTTEQDLWDIDGVPTVIPPQPGGVRRRAADSDEANPKVIEPQGGVEEGSEPEEVSVLAPRSGRSDLVRRNLPGRAAHRKDPEAGAVAAGAGVGAAEDGDLWEDLADEASAPVRDVSQVGRPEAEVEPAMSFQAPPQNPVLESQSEKEKKEEENELAEEFSAVAGKDHAPVSLIPRLALNPLERIGLIGFVVLMVAGGIFFYAHSINRLPSETVVIGKQDFPVQGVKVRVESMTSHWREPAAAEIVRRGTVLIPAVDLRVSGGPGAIRVFFNDADGNRVGDPVNRAVDGDALLEFAATAGFENFSMHPAYRAGESDPWTIEVFEGPSVDATGDAFKKLLEIPVSPDRR